MKAPVCWDCRHLVRDGMQRCPYMCACARSMRFRTHWDEIGAQSQSCTCFERRDK